MVLWDAIPKESIGPKRTVHWTAETCGTVSLAFGANPVARISCLPGSCTPLILALRITKPAKRFRFVDQNLIFALNRIVRASVRRSAVLAPNDVLLMRASGF